MIETKRVKITLELDARLDSEGFSDTDLALRVRDDVAKRLCNPDREDCGALRIHRATVVERPGRLIDPHPEHVQVLANRKGITLGEAREELHRAAYGELGN